MNDVSQFNKPFDSVDFLVQDVIFLNIQLTHNCNYSCFYCYDKDNALSGNIPVDGLKLFLESYKLLVNKPLHVDLLGGEPTLHPQFLEIVEVLNSYEFVEMIRLTTNGSASRSIYSKVIDIARDKLTFLISYHPSNRKGIQYYEDLLKFILSKEFNPIIAFMADPNISIKTLDYEYKLLSKYASTKIHPLYDYVYSKGYSDWIDNNFLNVPRHLKINDDTITITGVYNSVMNPFINKKCSSMAKRWTLDNNLVLMSTCNINNKYNCNMFSSKKFDSFIKNTQQDLCKNDTCYCWMNYCKTKESIE